MAISLANLQTAVYTRLRADKTSPSSSDINIDANSVKQWANESLPVVSEMLVDGNKTQHVQVLVNKDYPLTFTAGVSGSLPVTFHLGLAVRLVSGSLKIPAEITLDPNELAKWSSTNFLLTPQTNRPIALIADGEVEVKPSTFTSGYIDFLKRHPDLSVSSNTIWTEFADQILIDLIMQKYYEFQAISGEAEAWLASAALAHSKAQEKAYGLPRQPNTGQGQTRTTA